MRKKNHNDKIGKKFGKLTIWSYYHKEITTPSRTCSFPQAYCVCECGNFSEVRLTNLCNGKAMHCGCDTLNNQRASARNRRMFSTEDLIGKKFNKLTIWSEVNDSSRRKCVCVCECGNFCVAELKRVVRGNNKSCGCSWQNSWESKKGCTELFIEKAKQAHGEMYDYSAVKYSGNHSKVTIKCNTSNHGFFEQSPANHLQGAGCPKCRSAGYNEEMRGTLYILTAPNLVKVGITNKTVRSRINAIYSSSGIKFKEHKNFVFENGVLCALVEKRVLNLLRENLQNPAIHFDGYTEVFCTDQIALVENAVETILKETFYAD